MVSVCTGQYPGTQTSKPMAVPLPVTKCNGAKHLADELYQRHIEHQRCYALHDFHITCFSFLHHSTQSVTKFWERSDSA
jgi:hypothetical protein